MNIVAVQWLIRSIDEFGVILVALKLQPVEIARQALKVYSVSLLHVCFLVFETETRVSHTTAYIFSLHIYLI